MPASRSALEALFVAQLPVIDRLLGALCARNGYFGDEADDVCSWVKLRIVERDYEMLARFRGESSLASYLAVVLAMQVREYRVAQWGRWRPSAAALARGPVAIRLETLTRRDGMSVQQAIETMRTAGITTLSSGELTRLNAALPHREPMRPRLVEADAQAADPATSDALIAEAEAGAMRDQTMQSLEAAIGGLPTEEQVMVRMRFWNGLSIAQIARALGADQKPLYRRFERALQALRARLEESGVSSAGVQELLDTALPGDPDVTHARNQEESVMTGPSRMHNDIGRAQAQGDRA